MLRTLLVVLAVCLLQTVGFSQPTKRIAPTGTVSPEGKLLAQIYNEPNPERKQRWLEGFVAEYPKSEFALWVWGEIQAMHLAANRFDDALAAGAKVLAVDPEDIVVIQANLYAAEGKKDPTLIQRWTLCAGAAAQRVLASSATAEEKASAAQLLKYADYILYTAALAAPTLQKKQEGMDLLAKQNPQSQYLGSFRLQVFATYQAAGDVARALQAAEAGLKFDPNNEDMLLYAASKYYENIKDRPKAALYAKRLIDTLPAKTPPESANVAEWTRNRNLKLGIARWMLGIMASNEQRLAEADLHLRAALPYLTNNAELRAESLYHLALVNYKLGDSGELNSRILDAAKFNTQCVAIPSTFQAQAKRNLASMRSQYHLP